MEKIDITRCLNKKKPTLKEYQKKYYKVKKSQYIYIYIYIYT